MNDADQGLGDVTLLDIILLPQTWGTVGVGPLVSLGRNRGPDFDTLSGIAVSKSLRTI